MAAALLALVALPALAREGVDSSAELEVRVTLGGQTSYPAAATTANTRLGPTLYVSNRPTDGTTETPANRVWVSVTGATTTPSATTVTVSSPSGTRITFTEGADNPNTEAVDTTDLTSSTGVYFDVIRPTSAGSVGDDDIEALDGDTITVTSSRGGVVRLTVDGAGPTFSNVSPASGTLQSQDSVTVSFTVTDSGSGLRTDREDATAAGAAPQDNDGILKEPLSSDGSPANELPGGALDIDVTWKGPDAAEDEESRGSRSWVEDDPDHSYSLTYSRGGLMSASHSWNIVATDRVGNRSVSDAKTSTKAKDDYKLTVDNQQPEVKKTALYAGIGFDRSKNTETADRSSILLIFTNEGATSGDALDSSTIDKEDFRVVGNTVTGVTHPNKDDDVDEGDTEAGEEYTVKAGDGLAGETFSVGGDTGGNFGIVLGATASGGTRVAGLTVSRSHDHDGDGNDAPGDTPNMLEPFTASSLYDATDDNIANPTAPPYDGLMLLPGDKINALPAAWGDWSVTSDDKCRSHTGRIAEGVDDCIDTRNRVYLSLGSELDDDEEPEVQILGGSLRDKAGNGNVSLAGEDAADNISPTLTISVSGGAGTTGRALAMDEITVDVAAGERLEAQPSVWLVDFDFEGNITSSLPGNLNSDGTNAWTVDFDSDEATKVAAIVVSARDRKSNASRSKGWGGDLDGEDPDGQLDLADVAAAGLLVQFDNKITEATAEITPNDGDDAVTESKRPIIELAFGEGAENTKTDDMDTPDDAADDETHDDYTDSDDNKTTFDVYGMVTITAATIGDNNVIDGLARLEDAKFSLALVNLEVGKHTLEYTAMDEAGNEDDFKWSFEVKARKPYEVSLRPSWNLISLPATPSDTSIGSVLASTPSAVKVQTYQSGEWLVAIRDPESGEWAGTLTDIEAGPGYLVQVEKFGSLKTVIPESDPSTVLPTVQIVRGWNLVGVVDTGQRKADTEVVEADVYFSSIDWSVAYSFNAQTNRWERITKGDEQKVKAGVGYWVWANKAATLVP